MGPCVHAVQGALTQPGYVTMPASRLAEFKLPFMEVILIKSPMLLKASSRSVKPASSLASLKPVFSKVALSSIKARVSPAQKVISQGNERTKLSDIQIRAFSRGWLNKPDFFQWSTA